jgi:prepilin-type N-terminal cleavage/methylation domain-containing protein
MHRALVKKLTVGQRGFSFIELLLVLVVAGVLIALAINSYAGVQAKQRDLTRQKDIDAIAAQLEACYNAGCKGRYPSLIQLQDDSSGGWVETNLKNLDKAVLYDSRHNKLQGDTAGPGGEYQYQPYKSDGSPCGIGDGDVCTSYILKAWQEQTPGSPYTRQSLEK